MRARIIPIKNKNATLIIFEKNVPNNTVEKVFKNINKKDHTKLCKEYKERNKYTRKQKGGAARLGNFAIKSANSIMSSQGSIGGVFRIFKSVFKFSGGIIGTLIVGATVATVISAMNKSGVEIEEEDEIDYVELYKTDKKNCLSGIEKQNYDNSGIAIGPKLCYQNVKGTNKERMLHILNKNKEILMLERDRERDREIERESKREQEIDRESKREREGTVTAE
jgi:hypothetical protein